MMRSILLLAVFAALVMTLPLGAAAKIGGGDVTYAPKGADKVLFAHDYHVNLKGQKCRATALQDLPDEERRVRLQDGHVHAHEGS